MGLFKWFAKKFKCTSECAYNVADFADELVDCDLSKYQLKVKDLIAIENIVSKRPSIYNYKHSRETQIKSIEL